ncbi:hypothetical protein ACWC10_14220 [Streptomyces sp. NPDC001595]|uniref:hypothetical protein n=1 Tax=Streptomyces sp. NPDC001532 TaxID=3154520 RepID=UPI003318264B
MTQPRYDQRVRVFVEVRGGPHDWQEAEERFAAHGWPVRAHHPSGEGPLGAALEPDPGSRVYEIEVRLFGIAKGCDRGAADRVRKVARGARLEAYVRRADPLARDRQMYPHWRTVSTLHRLGHQVRSGGGSEGGSGGRGEGRVQGRRPAWRRHLIQRITHLGGYDRDGYISGTPRQALRLARAAHEAGPTTVAVRPLDGRWREPAPYRREEHVERGVLRLVLWSLLTAAALTLTTHATPLGWGILLTVALLGLCGAVRAGWELTGERKRAQGVLCAVLCPLVFTAVGTGFLSDDGQAPPPEQVLITAVVVTVIAGLWLLVRQWTWGEWVAWAVPLVATVTVSLVVAAGSVLHALYADGLSLAPDDLDVPPIWQVLAAAKLLVMLSFVLIVPAWWGFARHRHHRYATPGDGTNIILNMCLFLAMLVTAGVQAWDSAGTAVDRTIAAAVRGDDPPSYFGVEPEWTCVRPVAPAREIPGEGPQLHPRTPYLSFGVAGETAVLWDPRTGQPVKLPANQVWLSPAASGHTRCGP